MYLYLDESGTDGKSEYVFVGGVFDIEKIKSNLIKKNIIKSFKKSPKIDEYKFSNKIFDKKLKLKVLGKIKQEFSYVYFKEKSKPKNTKEVLCRLIAKCLEKVNEESFDKKVFIIYDKISEKIIKKDIEKFLKINTKIDFDFEMKDSKLEKGIQIADWIVGAARVDII